MKKLLCIILSIPTIVYSSQMSLTQIKTTLRMSEDVAEALKDIIDKNKIAELKELLENKIFNVNATGPRYAIRYNFRDYGYGPRGRDFGSWREQFSTIMFNDGMTPLMFAASYVKPEIIRELLSHGANVNQSCMVDGNNYYPLTVGYSSNFSDSSESEALVTMTQEFLKAPLSVEHCKQALNFVDTLIEAYSPELANKLRILLQDHLNHMMLSQEIIENHLMNTDQAEISGIAQQLSSNISKYL